MKKFRIVELIHQSGASNQKREFVIEKKGIFGWREVFKVEVLTERISFKAYDYAEAYLLKNYASHGMCTRIGCTYIYENYVY